MTLAGHLRTILTVPNGMAVSWAKSPRPRVDLSQLGSGECTMSTVAEVAGQGQAKAGNGKGKGKGKGRKEGKQYPIPDGGLTVVPKDWIEGTHKRLTQDNFADSVLYYDWAIGRLQAQVKELEQQRAEMAACPQEKREALAKFLQGVGLAAKNLPGLEGVDVLEILRKRMSLDDLV